MQRLSLNSAYEVQCGISTPCMHVVSERLKGGYAVEQCETTNSSTECEMWSLSMELLSHYSYVHHSMHVRDLTMTETVNLRKIQELKGKCGWGGCPPRPSNNRIGYGMRMGNTTQGEAPFDPHHSSLAKAVRFLPLPLSSLLCRKRCSLQKHLCPLPSQPCLTHESKTNVPLPQLPALTRNHGGSTPPAESGRAPRRDKGGIWRPSTS